MEHWLPLFYPSMATLFDYLPPRRPGRARPPGRGGPRRAACDLIDDAYDARAPRPIARVHYPPLQLDGALSDDATGSEAAGRAAATAGSRPSRSRGRGRRVDMGAGRAAASPPSASRTASTCSRPPLTTPSRWPGSGKRCCSPPGPRARPTGWVSMLADHGLKNIRLRAPTGTRPRRLIRRPRSAWCCRWSPDSRPTAWRSSPRPTSSGDRLARPKPRRTGVELPGRGVVA